VKHRLEVEPEFSPGEGVLGPRVEVIDRLDFLIAVEDTLMEATITEGRGTAVLTRGVVSDVSRT